MSKKRNSMSKDEYDEVQYIEPSSKMDYKPGSPRTPSGTPTARAFPCRECGRSFPRLPSLLRHLLIHTGRRPYPCPQCPATFNDSSTARRHLITHTTLRPYRCTECLAAFNDASTARRHRKRHSVAASGERDRPHGCKQCDKRFVEASDLRRHELVHTDERRRTMGDEKLCPEASQEEDASDNSGDDGDNSASESVGSTPATTPAGQDVSAEGDMGALQRTLAKQLSKLQEAENGEEELFGKMIARKLKRIQPRKKSVAMIRVQEVLLQLEHDATGV